MIDEKRLVQTLVGVYSFYDKGLTEFAIRVWRDACAEFDIGSVEEAFNRHLRDPEVGRWLPKPADIIRQLKGDAEDSALIAWGTVVQAISSIGHSGSPGFTGPTLDAVHSLGGWGAICRSDTASLGFMQKRFVDAFKVYSRRDQSPRLLEGAALRLIGATK